MRREACAHLCFNKDLAGSLRKRFPGLVDHIENVDRFFGQVAKAADRFPPQLQVQADPSSFFRQQLPWLVVDSISDWAMAQRYDAVIVDEGQDFSEDQLLAAIELLTPRRRDLRLLRRLEAGRVSPGNGRSGRC